MGDNKKQVMIFAVDDSEHSFYALEWTLDHLIIPTNSLFNIVVVHAKTSPSGVIGLAGPGASDVLQAVEADLKRAATKVIEKAKDLCKKKGVKDTDMAFDVVDGDARNVACDAVDKHHASLLVLGSHGYGTFKRAVLGSVSDFCSHHANCSVMIVKQPRTSN
nr:universal stress protein PHOS32-like [Ipomoea trifida]GMD60316.1 universal stress protein A-like protein [Ipomoea batatas]GMD70628.1 universal stress protein A-like protein [Ipomoea batatas]